jgi:hypothetical protein
MPQKNGEEPGRAYKLLHVFLNSHSTYLLVEENPHIKRTGH